MSVSIQTNKAFVRSNDEQGTLIEATVDGNPVTVLVKDKFFNGLNYQMPAAYNEAITFQQGSICKAVEKKIASDGLKEVIVIEDQNYGY